jgi:hypothetical protein
MKKYIYYVLEALLAIVIVFGLIRYFYGQDDAWMCINGTWEKYGTPRSAQPDFECPKIGEQVVTPPVIKVTNFSECEAAGFPVMEIYPRQCQGKDMIYVEEVAVTNEEEEKHKDLIVLDNIHAGSYISSPVTITGQARGNWFFEASFPISIVNWDGLIIGQGIATAKSDWMTEEFVPFEANITFEPATYKNNGAIILKKDNPSGLAEHDDALEIQIFFQ